jgi:heme exporter protein A
MLDAQDLAARRGEATLFSSVSFALDRGTALIVTGANGSGKTTLLRILAGLTGPEHGSLAWNGATVRSFDPALRAAALFIGHLPALKDDLTIEENLVSLATLHGEHVDAGAMRGALAALSLTAQCHLPARVLSQGQRRRIGLARLCLHRRPLWLLDEPATALDAAGVASLQEMLAGHLANGGVAVIATHQDLGLATAAISTLRLS